MSDALSRYSANQRRLRTPTPSQKNNDHHLKEEEFLQTQMFILSNILKNISNVTVFIFLILSRNINLARNTQEFLEMKPPKDQDMRMIPKKTKIWELWMLPQATAIVERQYCNDDAVIWQQEDLFRFKYYTAILSPKKGLNPWLRLIN